LKIQLCGVENVASYPARPLKPSSAAPAFAASSPDVAPTHVIAAWLQTET
jgi:hypothetical protein